ncbi:toll-like receptor 1 isoform X1 [Hydra vulgaris]|uniref:Toll-like receptor 1 isoform X1 n=1 Tax=Hydra vulgaris TaxID=6087 RepID=A0ABM4C0G7_HYDVU
MCIYILSQWLTLYTLVKGNKVWINSFNKVNFCSPANLPNKNIILQCDVGTSGSSENSFDINFNYYLNGSIQRFREKKNFLNETKILWSGVGKSYYKLQRNLTIFNASNSDINVYFCSVYGEGTLLARENFTLSNIESNTQCNITMANDKVKQTNVNMLMVATISFVMLLTVAIILLLKKMKEKKFRKIEKTYDVNICYAPKDRDWVVNTLVSELERKGIKTFINIRDDTPGNFFAENIIEAVENSNRTIVVMSPDFFKSNICEQTLQIGLSHQVILIMYRQCNVPYILSHMTYLDWCDKDVRPYFWRNLFQTIRNN